MDFLQNAQKQLTDLFESMTPGSRITAGLLLVAVVVGLLFLVNFSTSAPDELLLGGAEFASSDLQAMEAAFSQEQLNTYERVGNRIRIPRGQRSAYVAALAKHKALPSDFHDAFEKSLNEGGVFEPSKMRDSRQKLGKQRELSMIISAMNGVERATVQFDEQVAASFPRTIHKTAVVAVMPKGSAALEDSLADSIIDFLVHAIAGLKAENITVTDLKGNRSIVGGGMLGAGGSNRNPYPAAKAFHEQQWAQKIRTLLASIPGAAVSVNVELDPVLHKREHTTKIDPKPVPISTSAKQTTIQSSSSAPGGRPGFASNGGANAPATVAAGPARSQSEDTKTETNQSIPSVERTEIDQAPMVPTRVSVSVALPAEYYLQIHRQRFPPVAGQPAKKPDANELEGIQKEVETSVANMITPLLPKRPPGVDPYPQVVVTRLPELPATEVVTGGMTDDVMGWFSSNWSTMAMLGMGLFGLVTFRGMLSAMPTPPEPRAEHEEHSGPRLAAGTTEEESHSEGEAGDAPARRRRRTEEGGPNLRDELVEIVKEDPDAAAKILRSWIGDAA